MDVSMQSSDRIDKYLNMDTEALKNVIGMRIENPQIFKEFMSAETVNWDYAVAAGILTKAEVAFIKSVEEALSGALHPET